MPVKPIRVFWHIPDDLDITDVKSFKRFFEMLRMFPPFMTGPRGAPDADGELVEWYVQCPLRIPGEMDLLPEPGNGPKRASLCCQGANDSVPVALVSGGADVRRCLLPPPPLLLHPLSYAASPP